MTKGATRSGPSYGRAPGYYEREELAVSRKAVRPWLQEQDPLAPHDRRDARVRALGKRRHRHALERPQLLRKHVQENRLARRALFVGVGEVAEHVGRLLGLDMKLVQRGPNVIATQGGAPSSSSLGCLALRHAENLGVLPCLGVLDPVENGGIC